MISCNPEKSRLVFSLKNNLKTSSLEFADVERPNFVLFKEAINVFENILKFTKTKFDDADMDDRTYVFKMFKVLVRCFGTKDLEWFCAIESVINSIFNLHSVNGPQYAKLTIEQLCQVMLDARPSSITEIHYAQIFFVVGHVSIKTLTFIENLNNEIEEIVNS